MGIRTAVCAIMSFVAVFATASMTRADGKSDSSRAEKLLRDRLKVLQQIVVLNREGYRSGEIRFDSVLRSEVELLNARLELARTSAERVTIRTDVVKVAEQLENVSRKLAEAREASRIELLKAQAFHLRARADLLREKSRMEHKH